MPYLTLKMLHIVAVVLFLGNIITGVFWKDHADRSRDPRIILAILEGIVRSDRWFTIPLTYANRRANCVFFIETHHHILFIFSTHSSFLTLRGPDVF